MEESFILHLRELRQRLLVCCAALALAAGVAYLNIEAITGFFLQPLLAAAPQIRSLVYTNLTEAFIAYIKVALLVGLAAAMPVLVLECWLYVAPGLYEHEKRTAGLVVAAGSLLFALGLAFAFFAVLPRMLAFFMLFAGDNLQPLPKLGPYLTFVARLAIGCGIAFEIPFLVTMLVRTGIVDRQRLQSKRWYTYAGMASIAFLLAAGDLLATGMLLLPLILLYEAGIRVGSLFANRTGKDSGRA